MHRAIFKKPPPAAAGAAAEERQEKGAEPTTEHVDVVEPPQAGSSAAGHMRAAAKVELDDDEDDEAGDIAPLRTAPRPRMSPLPQTAAAARDSHGGHDDDDDDDDDDDGIGSAQRVRATEMPPIRIDDNDGRPLGPPSMATILGVPAAADPGQWYPPPNLATLPLDPLPWSQFYERSRDVVIPDTGNTFRAYELGEARPGKSLFVLHHGGGLSAQSWAVAAAAIAPLVKNGDGAVLAFDCRGHGDTHTTDDTDLSLETLANDMASLVKTLYGAAMPDLFLAGHSMGGAVVVQVASRRMLPKVRGVIVVDVVEGSAVDAIAGFGMLQYIHSRPRHFPTVREGVLWSLQSGTIRNVESARVSMPLQLKPDPRGGWTWRVDLAATERFWTGWYAGLSAKFLSVPAAKLLILAGPDRLDKPLMIGQMQGKFQLSMQPACGHSVQEDAPHAIARVLVEFMNRNAALDIAAIRQRTMLPHA